MSGGGGAPPAAALVAHAAVDRYAALPKTGKPAGHEHTVMAAFLVTIPQEPAGGEGLALTPVALATGTKCLGAARRAEAAARSPPASLLHDSHAEALARRAFLLWVHAQLRGAFQAWRRWESSGATDEGGGGGGGCNGGAPPLCFRWLPEGGRFALRPGVEFYMYVSQPPCGDASILCDDEDCGGGGDDDGDAAQEAAAAPGRTGAKLIQPVNVATLPAVTAAADTAPAVPQAGDVESPADGGQHRGALRRKPGRGDATLSMSCSDKLARWQALGLQGALLSSLLEAPLRLSGVVASVPVDGGGGAADGGSGDHKAGPLSASVVEQALRRAVVGRFRAAFVAAAEACEREEAKEEEEEEQSAAAAATAAQLLRSAAAAANTLTFASAPPPAATHGLAPDAATRRVPTGLAVNWAAVAPVGEVTIGALGCRAGSGRAARMAAATRSRLSRASLSARFVELLALIEQASSCCCCPVTAAQARALAHDELKRRVAPGYCRAWRALLETPLAVEGAAAEEEEEQQQQHAFAGAWLRKPADVLALADFEQEHQQAGRGGRGGGGGGAAGRRGGDPQGGPAAALAGAAKRARVDGPPAEEEITAQE